MSRQTRWFLLSAVAVLVVGLGVGLIAYLASQRGASLAAGLPPEVRYVPANAELVAFADVRAVMDSQLRREMMPDGGADARKDDHPMRGFAGVDVEKQVTRVVAYVDPYTSPEPAPGTPPEMPHGLMLVHGTFDAARIEEFLTQQGAAGEDYNGRKMFLHSERGESMAVGFLEPSLLALGQADLVRRAIDRSHASAGGEDILANADMMPLIRDASGSTAWVVGQFDAVSRRMQLPPSVGGQVPPVRLVSAKADLAGGGMRATLRAEAGDKAAADQLRDVVRGFISLARLQSGAQPGIDAALQSLELSGTDSTVVLSFAVAPETLRALASRRK